jgi:hypothetical protein
LLPKAAKLKLGYGNDSIQNGPFGELPIRTTSGASSNVIAFSAT